MTFPHLLPPSDIALPEGWYSGFAAALAAGADVERAYLVRERYPDGVEQDVLYYELVDPPGDGGVSKEVFLALAESVPALPEGMIFTCTPRRRLADVGAAGRLIWEKE